MKRLLFLLIAAITILGCKQPTVPELEKGTGDVMVLLVSATEEPRILEDLSEETLINRVISGEKLYEKKERKPAKNMRSSEHLLAGNADYSKIISTGKGN